MNKKIISLIICIFVFSSMFVNTAIAAVSIEGVPTDELDDIIVHPLLDDYSWDQIWLFNNNNSDEKVRYYNRFMNFDDRDYPAGCVAVATGQLIYYSLGNLINRPSGDSFLRDYGRKELFIPFMGGSGIAGTYDKNLMPVCPNYNILTVNGELTTLGYDYSMETSAFLHDVAIALGLRRILLSKDEPALEGNLDAVKPALSKFSFDNSVYLNLSKNLFPWSTHVDWDERYDDILVTNLNAGFPVLFQLR